MENVWSASARSVGKLYHSSARQIQVQVPEAFIYVLVFMYYYYYPYGKEGPGKLKMLRCDVRRHRL